MITDCEPPHLVKSDNSGQGQSKDQPLILMKTITSDVSRNIFDDIASGNSSSRRIYHLNLLTDGMNVNEVKCPHKDDKKDDAFKKDDYRPVVQPGLDGSDLGIAINQEDSFGCPPTILPELDDFINAGSKDNLFESPPTILPEFDSNICVTAENKLESCDCLPSVLRRELDSNDCVISRRNIVETCRVEDDGALGCVETYQQQNLSFALDDCDSSSNSHTEASPLINRPVNVTASSQDGSPFARLSAVAILETDSSYGSGSSVLSDSEASHSKCSSPEYIRIGLESQAVRTGQE